MAGCELRIVSLADALNDLMPVVEERLRSDGDYSPEDAAVIESLQEIADRSEEDASVVIYALSLFRADARSRRSRDRRRDIESIFGVVLPPLPGDYEPDPVPPAPMLRAA